MTLLPLQQDPAGRPWLASDRVGKEDASALDADVAAKIGSSSSTRAALDGRYVGKGSLVFSVRDYGALGNWNPTAATGADDTPAIQAAINAAQTAGGGVVYFPPGNYRYQPQTARTSDPGTNSATDGLALMISASNIALMGASRETSKLYYRAYGGGDPSSTFQVVNSKVWRGHGIAILGGSTSATTTTNIRIQRLEINGGATYTGVNTFPANTSTGDGWDLTNKGVWLQNDTYIDGITIEDCTIHNFRGELVYSGGMHVGKITGRRLTLYGTNGDCWSCSATVALEDSELYQAAGHGVEDAYYAGNCYYRRNYIHDVALTGLHSETASNGAPPFGNVVIEDNLLFNNPHAAIELFSPQNVIVRRNKIVDCASVAGYRCINVDTNGGYKTGSPSNFQIHDNHMLASTVNVQEGIVFADAAVRGFTGVQIYNNRCELTAAGVANAVTFQQAYDFSAINDTKAIFRNNTARGTTYMYTDQASLNDVLITTTSSAIVAKLRPEMKKNFVVNAAFRVVTASTSVKIDVVFTDGSGAQQTVHMLAQTTEPVGYYTLPPVYFNAQGSSESQYINVWVTAGTANQVYLSVSISEVAPT